MKVNLGNREELGRTSIQRGYLAEKLLDPGFQLKLMIVLAAFLLLPKIGQGVIANYDDGYYAEKAKEILASGDWMTLHYAGAPKFDNPPLFIWLIAIAFKLFGVSKFSAVLFSALSGVLAVAMTYVVARSMFTTNVAYLSSFLLLTTPYFTKFSRRAMMDVFVASLYLLVFWSFIRGLRQFSRAKQPLWFLLTGFFVGLGVLTKSIIGFFPLVIIMLFLVFSRKHRLLVNPIMFGMILIFLVTALPWFLAQYKLHGSSFISSHFGWLIWKRAFVIKTGGSSLSHLSYFRDMLKNLWPWVIPFFIGMIYHAGIAIGFLNPFGGKQSRAKDNEELAGSDDTSRMTLSGRESSLLVTLWIVVVLGVMSLAEVRKLHYLMGTFPAMCIAAGSMLENFLEKERRMLKLVKISTSFLIIAAAVITLTPVKLTNPKNPQLLKLAEVASLVVPEGEEVLNLNESYWSVNNIFLFYSGRAVTFAIKDERKFREGLSKGFFALMPLDKYRRIFSGEEELFPIIAECGGWVLFKSGARTHAKIPPQGSFVW